MKKHLFKSDQLENHHFPIVAFFNAISDNSFVHVLEQFTLGVGSGINETVCTFPEDLDPGDEVFDGVMFSLFDEEVIVDYQTFFYYLKLACSIYLEDHPEDKAVIENNLEKIKKKYDLA